MIARDQFADLPLADLAFTATNFRIEEENLVCDIEICDTLMGQELSKVINEMAFRSNGIGVVDDNGVVRNWIMES